MENAIGKSFKYPNGGTVERAASVVAGAVLACYGIKKRSRSGVGVAALGAGLVQRGITGFCPVYHSLGFRTVDADPGQHVSVSYETGVRVDKAITVNRPRHEVFQFWRDVENLPRFMQHVDCVKATDSRHSHWVAKAPAGRTVEWDAEIINEIEGELIGWRSLPGSAVNNAGSVHFKDAAGGRGTEIRVSLQYNPPGGFAGALLAKWFGEDPSQQVSDDLRSFKRIMETGELATNTGQSSLRAVLEPNPSHRLKEDEVHSASEESFPASDAPAWR